MRQRITITLGVWCFLLLGLQGWAQTASNLRSKKIAVQVSPVQLDSLSIQPGSIRIAGIDTSWYWVDAASSVLRWKKMPAGDSVLVQYRVFPFSMNKPNYRYRYDSVSNYFKAMPGTVRKPAAPAKFMDFGNLSYTGSFGRSLSFGNAQDAVVNSLFNLQINGMLGDSIELSAAITDNNIPIQPDGTTQQLNEFDRIWMQFKKRNWQLSIGDIDVRQQPTYFLSFFKRQQGIAFETNYRVSKKATSKTFVSGAIAKGKFTRNIFQGQEGNQGPYRLQGANNELYFVLLAGTERVFIDGVQMQRGEDQDYVINYNTAEISFTPRQLINKDKRIQVEFEYADRNYLNSLLYLGNSFNINKKLDIDLGFYSNADGKNSPINQTLDTQQKQFLSELGDSVQNAFYPIAVRDSFDANKILYVKIDTVVNAETFTVYRYQNTPDTAMYSLAFTAIGPGKGNYVLLLNGANGTAYQWVAPINGIPQGIYEPVAMLVTPKKQQMLTAAVKYQLSATTWAKLDMGYSNTDVNTYSSKDKDNDGGLGVKAMVKDQRSLKGNANPKTLSTELRFEHVDAKFRPLERLRSIEFLRDWGLPFDVGYATEQLKGLTLGLQDSKNFKLQYDYSGYKREGTYNGNRHTIEHAMQWKGFQITDRIQYTDFDGSSYKGKFLRPFVEVSKLFPKLANYELGASYALEYNEIKSTTTDTLMVSSFAFSDWKAFVRSNAAKQNRWSFQWFRRDNQYPMAAGFVPLDVNNNYNLQLELFKNLHHKFRMNAGYRTLDVKTKGVTTQQSDKTLLGRAEYLMNLSRGAIVGNVLYEAGAGQEQQRDYSYIEVPAGRGEYTWMDYNSDGIPQLNEFELAQFADQANYIRIFTPTNRFVKAAYNTFNFSLVLSPANIWRKDSSSFKRFLSKWNAQTSLQTSNKKEDDGGFQLNPFSGSVSDTNLISLNTNIANTISFNRFSTNWGADIAQVRNTIKAILTYGFETRTLNDYSIRLRKNVGKYFTVLLAGKTGNNTLTTPNPKFDNRNYVVNYKSVSPSVTYTMGTRFRSALALKWDNKKGESATVPQLTTIRSILFDCKYNLVQSGVFTGKLSMSNIQFEGTENSTVSYIMLEGLQPGKNYLWGLEFTKRLVNALELSFQYEGRKPGDTRVIHVGRAALRAIL
ncbi:MAG TPA: hypothetical protein VLC98_03835 [Phnomibacter sp.]|nr:hypothetical protein [Phnomibacter sp.]